MAGQVPAFALADGRYRPTPTLVLQNPLYGRRQARIGRVALKRGLKLRVSRGTTPSLYLWDGSSGRIVFPLEWAGLDTYPLACWGGDQLAAVEQFLAGESNGR